MPLDPQCQPIKDEIDGLEAQVAREQERLRNAPPPQKPFLVSVIEGLNEQIGRRQLDLEACNAAHPPTEPPPTPQPLMAYFNGTYTFRTTFERAQGPYGGAVSAALYFSAERRLVRLIDLGSIMTDPYDTPFGPSTTTVSLDRNGGDTSGVYDPASGELSLRLPLFVDHSLPLPLIDSTLLLFMTTNGVPGTDFGDLPGSPVDQTGHLVASGSGPFQGGYLNAVNARAGLTLDGTITPHP